MRTNYRINSGVRFQMLSQDQLQELFDGVLHVLEYTGLEVHHDEARDILKEAGAWVDGLRVRLPSYMVKDALAKAPRSFTIWARDGNPEHDIHIGPGRAHFGPGPTCPNFIDIETMERRPYVKSDVAHGGQGVRRPAQHRLLRVAGHRQRRTPRTGGALRIRRDVPQHQQTDRRLVLRPI